MNARRIPVLAIAGLLLATATAATAHAYLREGGITDSPDGTLTLDPQRTDANMVAIYLGVTVRSFVDGARR